jgi:membrane-associated phospholipid phosphatase
VTATRQGRLRVTLGPRLLLAAVAAFMIAVPFTLLLVLVENAWPPLARLDATGATSITRWAYDHDLGPALRTVQAISQPRWFQLVVGLMALWFLVRGARRLALWAIITMLAGGRLEVVLKQVVARSRPVVDPALVHVGGYSFPSGHATNSLLGVGVLLLALLPLMGRRTAIAAWVVGVLVVLVVGFDRVAIGAHYISDVLAGWLVALALLAATTAAFETWRSDVGRRPTHITEEGVDPEGAQSTTEDVSR